MKRAISVVCVLLLVLSGGWIALSYWFGVKTQERYDAMLRHASRPGYLKFTNESYSRGFLRSRARTLVDLELPPNLVEGKPLRLTLVHDFSHGPFPVGRSPEGNWRLKPLMAVIETKILLSPEVQGKLGELYAQVPEMGSLGDYTLINLDGSGEEHFVVPSFDHTFGSDEKVSVAWKGLTLQINFTSDLKRFTGSMAAPGLEASGNDLELKLKEATWKFDHHEDPSGLWLGDASCTLAGLDLAPKKGEARSPFLIQGFGVTTSAKASGDTVSLAFSARTERLAFGGRELGPGSFELQFRNLDAASLVSLERWSREVQGQPSGTSAKQAEGLLEKGIELLPALLKRSPEVEIKLMEVKTSEGDFAGMAKVAFDGSKAQSAADLSVFAKAITAQAELKVAEGLLHRVASMIMKDEIIAEGIKNNGVAPGDREIDAAAFAWIDQKLQGLVEQNVLIRDNGNYAASASYRDERALLNGRSLPGLGPVQ